MTTLIRTFLIFIIFNFVILYSLEISFSDKEYCTSDNLIEDFFRVEPCDSLHLDLETKVWLWHDLNNLYLKIEAKQGPEPEASIYTADDIWPQADFFRLQIITDVKNYYSYCYYFFPLGNRYDGVRDSGFDIDKNWDSDYFYTSEFSENDWKINGVIPFSDLRFFPNPPYEWKIILTRYFKDTNEHYSYPGLHTSMGNDYFRRAADLIITHRIRKSRNYFIRPYVIGSYDRSRKKWQFDEEDLGVDFSYLPDFSSKINISFNPDFTDVPIDDEIDIYNLKYTPAYPENRYFFIEDFNAFGLNYDTFYSRHLKQPLYAIKITRNTPGLSWGILSAKENSSDSDEDYFNIVSLNPTGHYYRLNFALLSRANQDYHNEVLQIAPRLEFSDNKFIWMDLKTSFLDRSDEKTTGYHFNTGLDLQKRNFILALKAEQMSRDYALDMGKIYEDDFMGWQIFAETTRHLNRKMLRSIKLNFWVSEEIDNREHYLLERFVISDLEFVLNNSLELTVDTKFVREFYAGKYFNKNRLGLIFDWSRYNWINLMAGYYKIEALIYEPGFIRDADYFQLGIKGDLGKHLAYSVLADNVQYKDLNAKYGIDDNYWIINSDLSLNVSNSLSCTAGLRYNNYNWYAYEAHTGYFLNFNWEYRRDCNLYLGYKYSADEIEDQQDINYEILYLKIAHTL